MENKASVLAVVVSLYLPKTSFGDSSGRLYLGLLMLLHFLTFVPSTTTCTAGHGIATLMKVKSTGKRSAQPPPSPTATSVDAVEDNRGFSPFLDSSYIKIPSAFWSLHLFSIKNTQNFLKSWNVLATKSTGALGILDRHPFVFLCLMTVVPFCARTFTAGSRFRLLTYNQWKLTWLH